MNHVPGAMLIMALLISKSAIATQSLTKILETAHLAPFSSLPASPFHTTQVNSSFMLSIMFNERLTRLEQYLSSAGIAL